MKKVIIVGRTNAGKSTLFNRLIEKSKALVSPIAGTTRDFNQGVCGWRNFEFEIFDTGGIDTILPKKKVKQLSKTPNTEYSTDIIKKTQATLKKADLVLFVVDIKAGLLPADKEMAKTLKKLNIPVYLVINKMDNPRLEPRGADFYKLGFDNTNFVSALTSIGTGDLLDEVVKYLKKLPKDKKQKKEPEPEAKISIIGRPNVGKSSLLNAIIGEERVIVSPIALTTREPHDIEITHKGHRLSIIDTAGIRKQPKIKESLEKFSSKRSLHTIQRSDICLYVIDINKGVSSQDKALIGYILDCNKSLILVANKWDLVDNKSTSSAKEFEQIIYRELPFITWVPIIFVSAKSGQNVQKLLSLIIDILDSRKLKISDKKLDIFLKKIIKHHRPKAAKGTKAPRLIDMTQDSVNPPVFSIVIKGTDLNESYLKYIENQLRKEFKYLGTAIKINFR